MALLANPGRLSAVVVAGLLAVTTTGCSDSDEPESPSTTEPASAESSGPAAMSSTPASAMALTSPAFSEGDQVPVEYTCDGANGSPPLSLAGVPEGTVSLVIVLDDPDAPTGTFVHWVVYDAPVTDEIPAGTEPGTQGTTSFGRTGYGGPCPPAGDGDHRYVFRVLALDAQLDLPGGETKAVVLAAAEGSTLAEATLTGRYGRSAGAHE